MSNSPLVDFTSISPNSSNPRKGKITKITIHHTAGKISVEAMGNVFKPESRKASANYGVDSDGRVGMYVEEKNRAWTSGSWENDNRAITIETSNSRTYPNPVSDAVYQRLINLCADICKRNGKTKTT
jgi:N-acetyl-anhydromuramyl-L-alanine amidase AmpD